MNASTIAVVAAPIEGEVLGVAETVTVVLVPHPFHARREIFSIPAGLSLEEIAELAAERAPAAQAPHFTMSIGHDVVARELWSKVRPKAGVSVIVRAVPRGGGGQLLRSLAMLFVAILTAFVAPYLTAIGLSSFAVASISAPVSMLDALRLDTLFPARRQGIQ